MQRELDKELMDIKREIGGLRDKVVSATAMMTQAETAIQNHLNNILQLILDDGKKVEFEEKANDLFANLSSNECAEELFKWINSYVEGVNNNCAEEIDKLKEDVQKWKEITE